MTDIESNRAKSSKIFTDYVYPHILADLDILDTIQPVPGNTKSTCAIPTLMLILGSLDMFGYLLNPRGKTGESEENIRTAIKFKEFFPPNIYDDDCIEILVRKYRHGVMHAFYPLPGKKIYGVHKNSKSELFEMLNNDSIQSLNVNVLSKDFRQFVLRLFAEINRSQDAALLYSFAREYKIDFVEGKTMTVTTTQTTIRPGLEKDY